MMHSTSLILCLILTINCVCNCRAFDADEDVIFKLYTRENLKNFTILKLDESRSIENDLFDPQLPTRVHVHGFLALERIIDRYREAYLSVGDYNFIVVDWLKGAYTLNYFMAKRRIKDVREIINGTRASFDLFIK